MTEKTNTYDIARGKTLTWVVLGFSIVFFFVLANGYFNLFISKGEFLAWVVGILLASIAWSLAKFIGTSPGGIKSNAPLFVMLLLVSAVGVFNSLMVNLEGKRIFQEAIDESSATFHNLLLEAENKLTIPSLEAKRARVDKLKIPFYEELRNPINCGQGASARKLAQPIKDELPEFQVLSGRGNCANIPRLISSYDEQIETLLRNSPEFTNSRYNEIIQLKDRVKQADDEARKYLIEIKNAINNGANPLTEPRRALEDLATSYQNLVQEVSKYAQNSNSPRTLNINAVRNLGEWSQLLNLIFSRLDKPATYVYLALAFFFDWILVYLFSRLSDIKRGHPIKHDRPTTGIKSPW